MIGGVVASTRSGGLKHAQFLVCGGKNLEFGPGLVGWIPSFPLLAVVVEHFSLEYQLICDADKFQWVVRGIPGRGVLDGAFDLVDYCLNGQVGVVRPSKFGVVVLEVGGGNVRVRRVKMI